jgi:hypothetical protein
MTSNPMQLSAHTVKIVIPRKMAEFGNTNENSNIHMDAMAMRNGSTSSTRRSLWVIVGRTVGGTGFVGTGEIVG